MAEPPKQDRVIETPRHVAVIMDGNGRWARERGLPRIKGHEAGAESVRAIIRACRNRGIEYLTLYAFSSENWARPRSEVSALMHLLERFLRNESFELHENRVRLRVIGRLRDLPLYVRRPLRRVMRETESYTDGHLILALNYGSRLEITDAVRAIAKEVKEGTLKPGAIDEQTISDRLYTANLPDPDLMIRTSGELRLSNFLLWQLSYAEFFFSPLYWPDFREEAFAEALDAYSGRRRRYGQVK